MGAGGLKKGNLSGDGGLGAKLSEALLSASAAVSPHEDARGFVSQTLLPVLGPAIEQLLHHAHETGELQKALQSQAERDGRPRRNKSKERYMSEAAFGDADRPDAGSGFEEPEDMGLDPLAWLADFLRQYAKGSAEKYRPGIEQRIAELIRIQEEEAAAQAAREAAAELEEEQAELAEKN